MALSILLAVHLPLMMIAGTILMEHATAKVDGAGGLGVAAVLRQVGANLARNPLVIALVLGTTFNLSGIGAMPVVLKSVIDQIAAVTSAAALISLGMTLRKYPIKGNLALAAAMAALKLMLLPACVFALAHLLGLSKPWTAAMVLTSSCQPVSMPGSLPPVSGPVKHCGVRHHHDDHAGRGHRNLLGLGP